MPNAVIVDAVRTAVGRRNGQLKDWHPVDLAAETLRALVTRNDLDPALVEDVIMGCVMQVGEQALNVGRNAALAAGFPETVVGTTIDRQCGSSQQAAHFAAQGVMAGVHDIVIAAGVEVMTRVPMGATVMSGPGLPFGSKLNDRYAPVGGLVPQGISAELIADKWNLSREALDAFSVESHKKAARATQEGRFDREIIPITVEVDGEKQEFRADEGIRPDSSAETLAKLKPAFKPDG
ncbi:MAG TPA: thiolase family protein, partial [Acidimicrobiia bacterium]|nr:thiolase family protein [Acidimicrobiia bacterium]